MGGQEEYDFLYKKYLNATWPSEVSVIISALGASKNPDILNKCVDIANKKSVLKLLINIIFRLLTDSIAENSPFKTSDARAILSAVQNNPDGTNIALQFIINNFFIAEKQWESSIKMSYWISSLFYFFFQMGKQWKRVY